MVHVLFDEGLADPGALAGHLNGVRRGRAAWRATSRRRPPPRACGIEAGEITRMARELAAAERAAVYGRIGTCTQEFGTLASWLVDVLNALTGNLDREGGAMFTRAAAGQRNSSGEPGSGRGFAFGRWHSRVRGLPEALGELPVSCLAEEIDTPGEGQVRALITSAGNPLRSTPNSERLERAVEGLDFMLSIDIYLNETTRHADVILPAPSPLEKPHYDVALYQLAARNVANYSPPALPRNGVPEEWETLGRLTGIVSGQGPDVDLDALDEMVITTLRAPRAGRRALAHRRPRRGRDPRRAGRSARPGAHPGPPAAHRPLRRRLRRGPGRAHARAPGGEPRTAWTSARSQPALPGALRTAIGQGGAGARGRSWPTCRACATRSGASTTARWCSWAAASCARTTPGCTTSSRW